LNIGKNFEKRENSMDIRIKEQELIKTELMSQI